MRSRRRDALRRLACAAVTATFAARLAMTHAGWTRRQDSEADAEASEPPFVLVPLAQLAAVLPEDGTQLIIDVVDQPGLHVLQTRSMAEQGLMFARIVALFEQRDMPRDAVLSEAELFAQARRAGVDAGSLTAGNNFSSIELARFFDLGRRQRIVLTAPERSLLALLVAWDLLRDEDGAWRAASDTDFLITLPGLSTVAERHTVDAPLRDAILSHELGHWRYFSDPAYANACRQFWWHDLTLTQRAALTRQLQRLGYDARDSIIIDELQAYLLHTPARYMPLGDISGTERMSLEEVARRLRLRTDAAVRER